MIYYFSATGNSLAMAKQLGEALEDSFQSITRVSEKACRAKPSGWCSRCSTGMYR